MPNTMDEFCLSDGSPRYSLVPQWVTGSDISDGTLRVYNAIASFIGDTSRKCHPGKRKIAKIARCEIRHVALALRALEEIGAVETTHVRGHSNQYRLPMNPPQGGAPECTGGMSQCASPGVHTGTSRSRPVERDQEETFAPKPKTELVSSENGVGESPATIRSNEALRAEAIAILDPCWEAISQKTDVPPRIAIINRIEEALAAGYTPDSIAAVLPTMNYGFSRNCFDWAFREHGRQMVPEEWVVISSVLAERECRDSDHAEERPPMTVPSELPIGSGEELCQHCDESFCDGHAWSTTAMDEYV